jgi:crossover junction endodeoxyribonuclease RusA
MSDVRLILDVPPSVNHYWVNNGRGGRVVGKEGTAFKHGVEVLCIRQGLLTPFTGRCVLTATIYRKENRGDIDNYLKALLDSLTGHVYVDDKQVIELHIYKDLDRKNPRVELTVTEVPEPPKPTKQPKPKRRALF